MTRLGDGKSGYGWLSILLHWVGAGFILAMLFIGNSTKSPDGGAQDHMLRLHTTLGLALYPLLWLRIWWRFRNGHPAPGPTQNLAMYRLGKAFHAVLLGALAVMLVSGPLLAWSGALPLRIGDLAIPAPPLLPRAAFGPLRALHVAAATVLGWGTLVHVAAVCKHAMVDRDGTFDRIMVPAPSAD